MTFNRRTRHRLGDARPLEVRVPGERTPEPHPADYYMQHGVAIAVPVGSELHGATPISEREYREWKQAQALGW